jgi:hypothetical protein
MSSRKVRMVLNVLAIATYVVLLLTFPNWVPAFAEFVSREKYQPATNVDEGELFGISLMALGAVLIAINVFALIPEQAKGKP